MHVPNHIKLGNTMGYSPYLYSDFFEFYVSLSIVGQTQAANAVILVLADSETILLVASAKNVPFG
jgi:hypothetical protein